MYVCFLRFHSRWWSSLEFYIQSVISTEQIHLWWWHLFVLWPITCYCLLFRSKGTNKLSRFFLYSVSLVFFSVPLVFLVHTVFAFFHSLSLSCTLLNMKYDKEWIIYWSKAPMHVLCEIIFQLIVSCFSCFV